MDKRDNATLAGRRIGGPGRGPAAPALALAGALGLGALGATLGGGALLPAALAQDSLSSPLPTAQLDGSPELGLDPMALGLLAAAEGVEVPAELLETVTAENERAAEQAIAAFLSNGNPTPQEVAARAVALSRALRGRAQPGGPTVDWTDRIGRQLSSTLCAPRVMAVGLDEDYRPREGAYAYDLGGLDTPLANGFERLTPQSPEVVGGQLQVQSGVGQGDLMTDVVGGLSNLVFELPNDEYRVILLTTATVADLARQPYGTSISVNGVTYHLGDTPSDTWRQGARLVSAQGPASVVGAAGVEGGALRARTNVADGRLRIDFMPGTTALTAVLSGVIIEPLELDDSLDVAGGDQIALEECLELELQTQVAMLEGIAPAAGPEAGPGRTGEAISRGGGPGGPTTPFDPEEGVSPVTPN